jgi:[ribosomal protein S5]-alanine N-acetyltransferase
VGQDEGAQVEHRETRGRGDAAPSVPEPAGGEPRPGEDQATERAHAGRLGDAEAGGQADRDEQGRGEGARRHVDQSPRPGAAARTGSCEGAQVTTTRPLQPEDADVLARIIREDRAFLAPWEPTREESSFTEDGQLEEIQARLEQQALGLAVPHVVLDDAGQVIGRITLNNVVRGAFQSCSLGYWIRSAANGRGHATAAVREMVRIAFDDLDLHRVEAGTLPHNAASQRVLERNGFVRFGLAPQYLRIAGRWQDHVLFQLLNPAMP